MRRRLPGSAVLFVAGVFILLPRNSAAQPGAQPREAQLPAGTARPAITIPRVKAPPRLEEFETAAVEGIAAEYAEVSGFLQQLPTDGAQASQGTRVYLGYDDANLYLIWVCSDSSPDQVRANVSRRENILDDDYVQVTLDTFADRRHATVFASNALGVQADGLWTEGAAAVDYSWDGIWRSLGARTAQGYIVLMEIPFHTLRFHWAAEQEWSVTLLRVIARSGEQDYWPRVSSRVAGQLNQAATLRGLKGIRPGHNVQLDPHLTSRSFRAVDARDATNPHFSSKALEAKPGLEAKVVLGAGLVLDATANPDFSQVESDEPQNAVNQRFELYYSERRPFFLENANYFASAQGQYELTPLVFTRRIADPDFGVKLTGKLGPWTLGALAADDKAPGEIVSPGDPLAGRKATFFVVQAAHDIGAQSSLGVIYTDREFAGQYNRVGGLVASFRLGKNWNSRFHSVASLTLEPPDGKASSTPPQRVSGYDHEAVLAGSGRRFQSTTLYQDIGPAFRSDAGYLQRTDIRSLTQYYHFYFRPEGSALLSWGPEANAQVIYDHAGVLLRYAGSFDPVFAFQRNTYIAPVVTTAMDTLRPQDFSGLTYRARFVQNQAGLVFGTNPIRQLSWRTLWMRGGTVNVVPPAGQMPNEADSTSLTQTMTIRPAARLQIDSTYILARVVHNPTRHAVFDNHIARTKWNYQVNRELGFRFIAQYNGLLANPAESSLRTQKNVNFDFLLTYLLHPGTAIYIGYNSDLANLLPGLCVRVPGDSACEPGTNGPGRTPFGFINDGRQLFFKISYLIQR